MSPTAEIMAAYVRARRRVTGAKRWASAGEQHRIREQARVVLQDYDGDWQLIVEALNWAHIEMNPATTYELVQAGHLINLSRCIALLLVDSRSHRDSCK